MKSFLWSLALLLTLVCGAQAAEFVAAPAKPKLQVQTVGVVRPWRGWGVYRPYGAPVGWNNWYGGGYYGRPWYGYRAYGPGVYARAWY